MELGKAGWALDAPIDRVSDLKVTAKKNQLAFQIQTGNMARAPYDLLKIQHLYLTGQIDGGVLALPSEAAARSIGDNIANFDRIWKELRLFDRQVTVPMVVVAFE